MTILSARNHFKSGLMAIVEGRHEDAVRELRAAVEVERDRHVRHPQLRYLSYYGLSLALANRAGAEAIRACETAVRREPEQPEYYVNLARVLARAGRATRALETLERGLRVAPRHRGLLAERSRLDRRRRPPLPMLDRAHPLNRVFGRLRARWVLSAPAAPRPEPELTDLEID